MLRSFVASLAAVAVVSGAILATDWLHHTQDNSGDPTVHGASLASPGGLAQLAGSPGATPASAADSPRPSSTPTTTGGPAGSPSSAAKPGSGVVRAPLVVYNASRIKGLAARAAAIFRASGWQVERLANLHAWVAETTVYYDPPDAAAARALVEAHFGVLRALPRTAFLEPTGTLIVVVTRDFATG